MNLDLYSRLSISSRPAMLNLSLGLLLRVART